MHSTAMRRCSIANELAAMSRTDSRRQLEADMYRLYRSTHGGYANSKVGGAVRLGWGMPWCCGAGTHCGAIARQARGSDVTVNYSS